MNRQRTSPTADAWAVILERGYSESFIAKVAKLKELDAGWNPAFQRWLSADSDIGIVASPMRKGLVNVRTAFIADREDLPEAIQQINDYLADCVGSGKRISWAQGRHACH